MYTRGGGARVKNETKDLTTIASFNICEARKPAICLSFDQSPLYFPLFVACKHTQMHSYETSITLSELYQPRKSISSVKVHVEAAALPSLFLFFVGFAFANKMKNFLTKNTNEDGIRHYNDNKFEMIVIRLVLILTLIYLYHKNYRITIISRTGDY